MSKPKRTDPLVIIEGIDYSGTGLSGSLFRWGIGRGGRWLVLFSEAGTGWTLVSGGTCGM